MNRYSQIFVHDIRNLNKPYNINCSPSILFAFELIFVYNRSKSHTLSWLEPKIGPFVPFLLVDRVFLHLGNAINY
jgi:hypothetical protein